jgi:hypothetical protein
MPSSSKFEGQQAPISLEIACSALRELWSPRVVGQVNNQYIKVAKVQGEFPWHSHEHEDRCSSSFVVSHISRAEADGSLVSSPRRVLRRSSRPAQHSAEETWIALIETTTTLHTGSEQTALTRSIADQLGTVSK